MMLEDLKITAMKKIKHEKTGKATWVCFNEGITQSKQKIVGQDVQKRKVNDTGIRHDIAEVRKSKLQYNTQLVESKSGGGVG